VGRTSFAWVPGLEAPPALNKVAETEEGQAAEAVERKEDKNKPPKGAAAELLKQALRPSRSQRR
jgi:hypothetical protein